MTHAPLSRSTLLLWLALAPACAGDDATDKAPAGDDTSAATDSDDTSAEGEGEGEGEETDTGGIVDSDGDRLSDGFEESVLYTDPANADSDGDGYEDGDEYDVGADPNDASSIPSGPVLHVVAGETDSADLSFTLAMNVDVLILSDTTAEMDTWAAALTADFPTLSADAEVLSPGIQFGYATFEDYPVDPWGLPGTDGVFAVRQQITDDITQVERALADTEIHDGGDLADAGIEALYQATTGAGYDLNCDGAYDPAEDVLPFIASPGDPFGGTEGQVYDASDLSTGPIGGAGFRDYGLPIVVLATSAPLRNPESPDMALNGVPGGCPGDAGFSDLLSAFSASGARLLGITVNGVSAEAQLKGLALTIGSLTDRDGDGVPESPMVYAWDGTEAAVGDLILTAIDGLLDPIHFDALTVESNGGEFATYTLDPSGYADAAGYAIGDTVSFHLDIVGTATATEEDQVEKSNIYLTADATTDVGTQHVYVIVPGTTPRDAP